MQTLLEWFDPAQYMEPAAYLAWWRAVIGTLTTGVPARLFAGVLLFYSFWYGVYKQRFAVGLLFFLATLALAYGAGVAWLLYPR